MGCFRKPVLVLNLLCNGLNLIKKILPRAGWATLASIVCNKKDEKLLDTVLYKRLLERISKTIHSEKNRVRYTMNNFVIAVGGYCPHLSDEAIKTASTIGKVKVDMGGTACKVPDATEYITKMHDRGMLGNENVNQPVLKSYFYYISAYRIKPFQFPPIFFELLIIQAHTRLFSSCCNRTCPDQNRSYTFIL